MEQREDILFPFAQVRQGSTIVLYGAGDVGQTFYHQIIASAYCSVAGWVDSRWAATQELPAPFIHLDDLRSLAFDCVVIALASEERSASAANELEARGIALEKIVRAHNCRIEYALCHPADSPVGAGQTGAGFMALLAAHCGIVMEARRESAAPPGFESDRKPSRIFNIALTGTGKHAETMANCIKRRFENARLYAVASRSMEKVRTFAARHGIPHTFDSALSMAQEADIDLVHICTPTAVHHDEVLLFLRHGKNVLCEKPFAMTMQEAQEMIAVARENKVFLAEALWPRYMPMAKRIAEILRSGILGNIRMFTANLFYPCPPRPGRPLYDVACYLLSLAELVLGRDVRSVHAGMDKESGTCGVTLEWGGALVSLNFGPGVSDRLARVYAEKGYMEIEKSDEYRVVSVYTGKGLEKPHLIARYDMNVGYEYEVRSCLETIERGDTEPACYPHENTLFVMGLMDTIKQQLKGAMVL
jgi:predicted dehydrogenase